MENERTRHGAIAQVLISVTQGDQLVSFLRLSSTGLSLVSLPSFLYPRAVLATPRCSEPTHINQNDNPRRVWSKY
jgi:hypothetical protein